ncbi:hypothetical protein Tco_1390254 [Tanacetum coccineum]
MSGNNFRNANDSRNANNNTVEDAFVENNANNTATNNVNNVVNNGDLPQLLDSSRGSQVTNVPKLDDNDFDVEEDTRNSKEFLADLNDDESLSSGDEGTTTVRSFMAKQVTEKESLTKSVNKKTQSKTPAVPDLKPEKKADTTTEELLLTLMKEIKGLMEQIKPSSKRSPFFLSNREF